MLTREPVAHAGAGLCRIEQLGQGAGLGVERRQRIALACTLAIDRLPFAVELGQTVFLVVDGLARGIQRTGGLTGGIGSIGQFAGGRQCQFGMFVAQPAAAFLQLGQRALASGGALLCQVAAPGQFGDLVGQRGQLAVAAAELLLGIRQAAVATIQRHLRFLGRVPGFVTAFGPFGQFGLDLVRLAGECRLFGAGAGEFALDPRPGVLMMSCLFFQSRDLR